MSKGFEGYIRIAPDLDGWLGTTHGTNGKFIYADSESMHINKDIKELPNKITYGRTLKPSDRIMGKQTPGGDIEYQFRSDDVPFVFMSHFQKYTGSSVGSVGTTLFTFVPEKGIPDFGGSAFGTGIYTDPKGDLFTFNVVKKFFDTSLNAGTNAQWYKSCVADELMLTLAADDDAKLKMTIKAGDVDYGTAVPESLNPNSSFGSYSVNAAYQYWAATCHYDGTPFNVTKLELTSKNNMEDYISLGAINPTKFRYGRYECSGSFDLDFPYDGIKYFGSMLSGSSFTLAISLYNTTEDVIGINIPLAKLKPIEADMKGGDQETTFSLPFSTYESQDGSIAPVSVSVTTLGYGTSPWLVN